MTRILRDTLSYILAVIVCIVMLVWAIPTYSPPYPGYGASPALVPNVAVGIILVMAILALVRNALAVWADKPLSLEEGEFPEDGQGSSGFTQVGRVEFARLLIFMVPCALYIPVIDWIGYIPASLLFVLVLQLTMGERKVMPLLLLSPVLVAFMYIAMRYGFGVPVPGA